MSLLDNLVNSALQGGGGNQASATSIDSVLQAAGSLLQSQGGIQGLLGKFQQAGLSHIVQSWIGTGQNAAISGSQVAQVLGDGALGQVAKQLGVDHAQAGNLLAQYLPQLVDHLTPGGNIPQGNALHGDMLGNAFGALKKLMG